MKNQRGQIGARYIARRKGQFKTATKRVVVPRKSTAKMEWGHRINKNLIRLQRERRPVQSELSFSEE